MSFGKTTATEISELGNWNNAKIYNTAKIMSPLIKIDEYIEICQFGTSELTSEFLTNDNMKTQAKLIALKRLIKTTEMLINNSLFAIYDPKDKEKLKQMKKQIKLTSALFPLTSKITTSQTQTSNTKTITINEKIFDTILDIMIDINREILTPLNKADLIFKGSEEYDPMEYKKIVMAELSGAI